MSALLLGATVARNGRTVEGRTMPGDVTLAYNAAAPDAAMPDGELLKSCAQRATLEAFSVEAWNKPGREWYCRWGVCHAK
jgi:hypothetical protein